MKLKLKPFNNYLLCKKIVVEEQFGEIVVSSDITSAIPQRAEIIAASPKLGIMVDEFKDGDIIIYPKNTPVLALIVDGEEYIMVKKEWVLAKVEVVTSRYEA